MCVIFRNIMYKAFLALIFFGDGHAIPRLRYHALLRIAGHTEVDDELVKGCSKELVPWSASGL